MKKFVLLTLLVVLSGCYYAQTVFNKLVDYNRNESHILVSLTPVENGYITVCGTRNYDLFNDMRCSLVASLDDQGNYMYNAFIGDSLTYTWESDFWQKIIRTDDASFKYVFNKEYLGAYICEFNDTLGIKETNMLYYALDSSFTDENFIRFSYIDGYIYIYMEKREVIL